MKPLSLAIYTVASVILLSTTGCDSAGDPDPSNSELQTNTFVVEVTDQNSTTNHEGAASASVDDYTGVSVDSAIVNGKALQIDLQLASSPEVYFSIRREAANLEEATSTGTYDLGVPENETNSPDGFRGIYRQWSGDRGAHESAICETGSVTLDTFTQSQITGSFTCTASKRTRVDAAGNSTSVNEPISLEGRFVVGVADDQEQGG